MAGKIHIAESSTTPSSESGYGTLYCLGSVGNIYFLNDDGVSYNLSRFTVQLPMSEGVSSVTGSAASGTTSGTYWNYTRWAYDQTSTEGVSWLVPIPNRGFATCTLRIHWTAAGGSATNNVLWRALHTSLANDEVIDAAAATTDTFDEDALIATGDLHVITQQLTTSSWVAGELLLIEIQRYPTGETTSLASDALLVAAQLEFA